MQPSFVAKLLASVAEENGCQVAFYDSSKQKGKALPPSDLQFLWLLAPNDDFITPRNIMQLVLVQPHGLWAKISGTRFVRAVGRQRSPACRGLAAQTQALRLGGACAALCPPPNPPAPTQATPQLRARSAYAAVLRRGGGEGGA